METCAICRNKFESESPAVLFVSGYGNRKCLCPECEALLDEATAEEASEKKEQARATLMERATAMKEPEAVRVLTAVLSGESEEETVSAEEEAEMDAVWDEIAKEAPEKEEKPPLWASILPVVVIAAFIGFLVWFYFFR